METCAFCGRTLQQVANLIKSPLDNIYICDKCSEASFSVVNGKINKKSANNLRKKLENARNMEVLQNESKCDNISFSLTPSEIHKELDRFVIGQQRAKKVLSVGLYNHYKRLNDKKGLIKKSNILLAGPSGTGKTLLARTMAKILNVPFVIADVTSMTEAGYIGEDVESCLQRLLEAADGNLEYAQRGIIYLDEIDKIAKIGGTKNNTKDVSGEGVQTALLKLIESSKVSLSVSSNRQKSNGETILFDTTNILFIAGGAFEGLFDKPLQNSPIGFQTIEKNISISNSPKLSSDSLIKYGLMPEFVGRFPILCPLETLTSNDLIRILTEPEDAITKEYQYLFAKDGIKLEFTDEALEKIADEAIKSQTSARALRSILEDAMLNIMYDIPDRKDSISKCIITKECIETGKPKIIKKRQQRKKAAVAVSS